VYSMGPQTVKDFVRQRRRNYAGHLHLKAKYGYSVSSLENQRVVRIAFEEMWGAMRMMATLVSLAALEVYSRVLGAWDYKVRGRKHVVWNMAWTTKDPGRPAVDRKAGQGGGQHA
jgi:poly-beta-1,6-N-acetyl-D-glucosamine synthase